MWIKQNRTSPRISIQRGSVILVDSRFIQQFVHLKLYLSKPFLFSFKWFKSVFTYRFIWKSSLCRQVDSKVTNPVKICICVRDKFTTHKETNPSCCGKIIAILVDVTSLRIELLNNGWRVHRDTFHWLERVVERTITATKRSETSKTI